MAQHFIPTTVFSGFLGSGKTTIISHLIEELQQRGTQVIYIKNEIGAENVDGQIMEGKHIRTKELLNGCICCTLVGPFILAIDEIIQNFQPDRIMIEASGAADPSAIALMIDSHQRLQRDGVISVIDVVNFEGYSDLSYTAQNQTKFTDLLVFNKVELVDEQRKLAVVGYVRELNNYSPIVEAPEGKLSAEVAFGISSADLNSLLQHERTEHEHHTGAHHHDHLETDGISSFHLESTGIYTKDEFSAFITSLPGAVYRVKGFVQFSDGWQLINTVGKRTTFEAPPDTFKPDTNTIVCIGFHLDRYEAAIREQFGALLKK